MFAGPIEITQGVEAGDGVVRAFVVDEHHRHDGGRRAVDIITIGGIRAQVLLVGLHVARDLAERLGHVDDFGTTDKSDHRPFSDVNPSMSGGEPNSTKNRWNRWRTS